MFCIDKKLLKCIGFSLIRVVYFFFVFYFVYCVVFIKLGGVRNVGGLVIDYLIGNIFYVLDNNIYVIISLGNVYCKFLSGVNIGFF